MNEKYSLGQLVYEVGCLIKKYEETMQYSECSSGKLIKTKEVFELYPMLTQYGLEQATKENKIPIVKRGKLNYYDTKDIEKYIITLKQFKNPEKETCNSKIKYI